AGGAAGLRAEQEPGKAVGSHQRALARGGARVAQRREIELDVRTRELRLGAHEAAALVDADRERPAPLRQIAKADAQASAPGPELLVQRCAARTIEMIDAEMILQVAA